MKARDFGGLLAAALILASLASAFPLGAAELSEDIAAAGGDAQVMRIRYQGDFRTRESELAMLTALREGMPLSGVHPEAVVQRLLKAGLYTDIRIEYETVPGGVELTIWLREKWTLIPLPFAAFSNGSYAAGMTLFESDLFGTRSILLASAIGTSDGWMAALGYIDPFVGERIANFALFFSGGEGARKAARGDGSVYRDYRENYSSAMLSTSFAGGGEFRPGLRAGLRWSRPEAGGMDAPPGETANVSLSASLSWERIDNRGWFNSGPRLSLACERGLSLFDSATGYGSVEFKASFAERSLAGSVLQAGVAAEYGDKGIEAESRLQGPGFRTLPFGKASSPRYAAAHAGFELPILEPSWSVMTVGAFFEGGLRAVGPSSSPGTELFYGPGIGFRIYIRKVAVPAVGVDLAWALPAGSLQFSAAIGMSSR